MKTTNSTTFRTLLDRVLAHPLSRRSFIKKTGAAAGAATAAGALLHSKSAQAANDAGVPDDPETWGDVDVRRTVCLGCHSKCGITVRVQDDTILKIDGNPWHPNCAETGERLRFEEPLDAAIGAAATCCPKGQAGVEVMYNPLRIRQPLKRVGARGSGEWEAISWNQALDEIAAKIAPYYDAYDAGTTIGGHDALGSLANQVVFSPGRLQHGQKEFTDRFWGLGFGTVNKRHDHTSICETTHHVAGDFIGEKKKHHFKPDMLNAEYILWFGTNPLEANFPGQTLAKRTAKSAAAGVKHVIIDPRYSRAAAFSHRWLPVRPGGDGALAMGIARRILDLDAQDDSFLAAANNQAALAETDWAGSAKDRQYNPTDSSWLVVVKADAAEDEWVYFRNEGGAFEVVDPSSGDRAALARGKEAVAQWGVLELDGSEAGALTATAAGLDGVGDYVLDIGDGRYLAPVFQLYKARIQATSLGQYARKAGLDAETLVAVADEFLAAGRKAVATAYRGACQHTHGMTIMQAILTLNHLVGNWDWKGGSSGATGGHLHEMGGSADGQLSMTSQAAEKRSPGGPQITRVKSYFDSALAEALGESMDVPTRRPWFPYAYNGNYQELVPSIEEGYPYPVAALFSYWNNIPYSTPAAKAAAYRALTDESLLPLHVCVDIEMSEMAALADYILPDGSYFERWSCPHNSPVLLSKFSPFRSPVVGYYAGKGFWEAVENGTLATWNYTIDWSADSGPFILEDILLELGRRVAGGDIDAVPAVGTNAYFESHAALVDAGVSPSMRNELRTAWDWYWNILINFAIESGIDPTDDAALTDMAHRIVERGGWFQDTTDAAGSVINEYDGDYVKNRMKLGNYDLALHMFFEYRYPSSHPDKAGKRYVDPFSLQPYDPLPSADVTVRDASGAAVDDGPSYPYDVVSYKPMWHSQGRTDSLPSLNALEPENAVEMSTSDARRHGYRTGDLVRLVSATSVDGVVGRLKVTEGIRPGVLAVSHSRGRWENSGRSYRVNGSLTEAAPYRGKGLTVNPILRTDPVLGNVTLQEPIGGSASFYDTKVKVEKVLA